MTAVKRNYDVTKRSQELAELAARGEYQLIEPLDLKILEMLPVEGSLFGDLYPLGETVQNITVKLKGLVKITMISSRLRVLNIQGLVVKTKSMGHNGRGAVVWQRTARASKLLNDRKEKKG